METKRAYTIEREIELNLKGDTSEAVFDTKTNRMVSEKSSKIAGAPIIEVDTNGILRVKCPCLDRKETAKVSDTVKEVERVKTITRYEPTRWQSFLIKAVPLLIIIILVLLFLLREYHRRTK